MKHKKPRHAYHIYHVTYADDQKEPISLLLRLRLPWLFVGLILGAITTIIVSRFEAVLASNVSVAFFIPYIVYLSAAVGGQTEIIYVRNMNKKGTTFAGYFIKELLLGIIIGTLFGVLVGAFTAIWLKSTALALTVGLAMAASISAATLIGVLVPTLLRRENQDPAVGAGPFATVIQDLVSLSIYFAIASVIIL